MGYNIAKVYEVDKLSGGLVALSSFVISLGTSMTKAFEVSGVTSGVAKALNKVAGLSYAKGSLSVTVSGLIPGNQVSSRGYFTAIIIGFLAVIVFAKIMKKDITIKLPDSVPPAIAVPFTSIIPAFVAMYVVAILTFAFDQLTGKLIID
ncbi:PTS system, IIC component family protein [Catenibacterium mitsuokai DSM 15897]|nr:PTS system, IIC component family protein [Catenibacterium mitsuokai DSM 15897]